jgi:hypothetical protein
MGLVQSVYSDSPVDAEWVAQGVEVANLRF